jgi:hypothetical protein
LTEATLVAVKSEVLGEGAPVGTLVAVKSEVLGEGNPAARLVASKLEVLYSIFVPPAPPFYNGLTLPSLVGQGWSFHKKPIWSTGVASHVSGRSTRYQQYQYPLWEFEALWNGLSSANPDATGFGAQSLETLMGFFLQVYGQYEPWLFVDPSDYSVPITELQAIGDGSTTTFVLTRAMGGYDEPVPWVTAVSEVQVGGSELFSGFTFSAPNILTFSTAPIANAHVNVAFTFAFICRLMDDQLDFSEFMTMLFELQTFKFKSVRYLS